MNVMENTTEDCDLTQLLLDLYKSKKKGIQTLLDSIESLITREMEPGGRLENLVHSTKGRLKDDGHLTRKILRKLREGRAAGKPYDVTPANFFEKVTDLAAFRVMHLHPKQMREIHPILMALLQEQKYALPQKPSARVWDMETEKFYRDEIGLMIETTEDKLYSSVHYIIKSNHTSLFTGEIQVRTLADEVWGEVDHSINYPEKIGSVACREQIKSLAHVTASCNRLVDSIFESHREWEVLEKKSMTTT